MSQLQANDRAVARRDLGSCDKLQNVSAFDIAVIVLVARSNSIDDLLPLLPRIPEALVARILV